VPDRIEVLERLKAHAENVLNVRDEAEQIVARRARFKLAVGKQELELQTTVRLAKDETDRKAKAERDAKWVHDVHAAGEGSDAQVKALITRVVERAEVAEQRRLATEWEVAKYQPKLHEKTTASSTKWKSMAKLDKPRLEPTRDELLRWTNQWLTSVSVTSAARREHLVPFVDEAVATLLAKRRVIAQVLPASSL
jgi:hypothetical protein